MATQTSIANQKPGIKKIISVITKPMIGEICHQVIFSYGDELRLDFGEMSAYTHPKLAHLRKGSWQLGTRATPWVFKQGDRILTSSLPVDIDGEIDDSEIDAVKKVVQKLENKELINFVISDHDISLTLVFKDDYKLILEPDLQDDSGLAYWELFMPTEQILTVGPGFVWECKQLSHKNKFQIKGVMAYDEIAALCEQLGYRDKLSLAQLLIRLARKEEETQNPQSQIESYPKKLPKPPNNEKVVQYIVEMIVKCKPKTRKRLENVIRKNCNFKGEISEIISELQRLNYIEIDTNNEVKY
ncbi:hypothetical protein [Planktothrix agardhii]|jgi:hypothetical protein|uniref:hypothetical protein n=1 Tax=Planktothrix agardhii TaxID=1160 RepID=UPI002B210B83|nr:hypothetical protein [Planktothrix agardhii]MEA5560578.1 hypothetical protein [Planktothrix agardhii UHCC 0887]